MAPARSLTVRSPACTAALTHPPAWRWSAERPRSLPELLAYLAAHPCQTPGRQGEVCQILAALKAPPPCKHLRWTRAPDDISTPEALSLRVAQHPETAERLLALAALVPAASILDPEPVLGWELLRLALCGGEKDSAADWRSLALAPDTAPPLQHLIGAAAAVHGRHTPARRPEALDLLAALPVVPWVDAARALLAKDDLPDSRALRARLLSEDVEVRLGALHDWSTARSGNPLRASQLRRLAGRLHDTAAGRQLCDQLLGLSSNHEARRLLQGLGEQRRRGARNRAGIAQEEWDQLAHDTEPEWEGYDDDHHDRWESSEGHRAIAPLPSAEPIQRAVLTCVEARLRGEVGWSAQLGARLDPAQRALLRRAVLSTASPDADLSTLLQQADADPAPLLAQVIVRLRAPAVVEEVPLLLDALRLLWHDGQTRAALQAILPTIHPTQRLTALIGTQQPGALRDSAVYLCTSPLAQRLAWLGWVPPAEEPPPGILWSEQRYLYSMPHLLAAGGGSLESLPYPAFSLVVRGSASIIEPAQAATLETLSVVVERLRRALELEAPVLLEALGETIGEGALPAEAAEALRQHAVAYAVLRRDILTAPGVLPRSSHVRRFWARAGELAQPPPETWEALRAADYPQRLLVEGVAHALLLWSRQPPGWGGPAAGMKALWTHCLRLVAMVYDLPPVPTPAWSEEPDGLARRQIDHLLQALDHAPLELAQALGLGHEQGLPRLPGGAPARLEREIRQFLREAFRLDAAQDGQAEVFSCRPLSKQEALERGRLGSDCSTGSVPLRALSPHHVYYGLYQGEAQHPGYMTVYEAFAEQEDGQRSPVLVLETINVPSGALDPVQQDLLRIFEAISLQRGLSGLVVALYGGTWNYQNARRIASCRRFRRGEAVQLAPAEPSLWLLYEVLSGERGLYCAFRSPGDVRWLAPFAPTRDLIQPENAAEAEALLRQPRLPLEVLAAGAGGRPAAFISAGAPRVSAPLPRAAVEDAS